MSETPFPIRIQRSSETPTGVWAFFEDIRDVDDLNPAEEQNEAWECIHIPSEETIGMLVIERLHSGSGFINRVAVNKSYRNCGVGTALLEAVSDEYEVLECRVHVDNDASQNLMESFGFTRDGLGRYDELINYKYTS